MKKLIITLAALAMTFSAFAQGTVSFATRTLAARVTFFGGGESAGVGPVGLTAQLAIVGAGGALTLLTPTTTFQTSASAQWYVNAVTVTVPGFATGTTPTLRMVVWETSKGSYDLAKTTGWSGFSNDIVTPGLGGAGTPPVTPPNLVGLQSFVVTNVPEPTTYALLGLGGLALALRRRK